MKPKPLLKFVLGMLTCVLVAGSVSAVTYTETGDAGQSLASAQATGAGSQQLTQIFGSLLSQTDIDIFAINVTDFSIFAATTVNGFTGGLDTALFLFNGSGLPVYANDDGATVGSTLPAGSLLGPQSNGLYFLAISLSGSEPVNFANQLLFALGSSTTLRGPDPNTSGSLFNWDTSLADGTGTTFPAGYQIDLIGASTAVPEPSVLALYVGGGLSLLVIISLRRRRRTEIKA
jgi:hypothetical protein